MKYKLVYEQPLKPPEEKGVVYIKTQTVYFNASSDIQAREYVIKELKGKQFWYEDYKRNKFFPVKITSLESIRPIPIRDLKIDDMELAK